MSGDGLDRLLDHARSWLDEGRRLALVTVTSTWGSAPRRTGSHMLVADDGRFEGSVSGGCVEGEVLVAAADAIADGRSRRLDYTVDSGTAWSVGLPCGGAIALIVQPVSEAGFPPDLFGRLAAERAAGRSVAIATDLGSGRSVAGDQGQFVNIYRPRRRLAIVGAVHIAQSLIEIARSIDVDTLLIDPRERFADPSRFPGARIDTRWPDEALADFRPDAATAVVTLSHDTKIDDPALVAALASPAYYVAALGSRKSHAARLERLRAIGIANGDLVRIEGPAGIAIGAVGPAEIALSVAAGMIAAWGRGG